MRTPPDASDISKMLALAVGRTGFRHKEIRQKWNSVSFSLGGKLPGSTLNISIQETGVVDTLIRTLEENYIKQRTENQPETDLNLIEYNNIHNFSKIFIYQIYEIVRTTRQRKLIEMNKDMEYLYRQLTDIRVALAKHEIANDVNIPNGTSFVPQPPLPEDSPYVYDKQDSFRAHIMPYGLSERGSMTWHAINGRDLNGSWVERQDISVRFLLLFG